MFLCAAVIPSLAVRCGYGKAWESVSVAVLPTEASRIALSKSDGNVQKPTHIYAMTASACISRETLRL